MKLCLKCPDSPTTLKRLKLKVMPNYMNVVHAEKEVGTFIKVFVNEIIHALIKVLSRSCICPLL